MQTTKERCFLDITTDTAKPTGLFVRNDLKIFIEKVEKKGGLRVIGIVYDGSFTIEVLTEPIKKEENGKADIKNSEIN